MSSYVIEPARGPLSGAAEVPGDKSIGHRALLFGALASGRVEIRGLGGGEDNARTLAAAEAMGVGAEQRGEALSLGGVGLDGLAAPEEDIDCGNAGTAMRLLAGLCAGQRFGAVLSGDESLTRRPMRRVVEPLRTMGAVIDGESGPKDGEIYPPLRVSPAPGGLRGLAYDLPVASAQVKSALLLAGLYADGPVRLREPGHSRDHTERMLAYFGAPVVTGDDGLVLLDPQGWERRLEPRPVEVPGDPSAAAFVVAAALLAGGEVEVRDVGVNETRTGFLDVLSAMGARIEKEPRAGEGAEPTATLVARRDRDEALSGTIVADTLTVRSIDEIPILAVVAARASGVTEIRDAAELRVKESDRIATTCAMLRGLGVEVEERKGGMAVEGRAGAPLRAGRINAAGDHRIAMAAAVAGLVADGPVRVDDVENVATSFPGFPEVLRGLGATISLETA